MSDLELFGYFVLGIILSILVPIAVRWLKEFSDSTTRGSNVMGRLWRFARRYVMVAVASAIIGLLLLAVFRSGGPVPEDFNPFAAMLYGYAWDSTLQKLRTGFQKEQT